MNELEQIISIMEQFQKEQQQMKNDINNLYNTVKNSLIMQKNSTTDMNERVLPALKENKEVTRKGRSEFPGQDRPAFRRIPEPIDSNDPETGADEPGPAWAAPEKRPPASQCPDRNSGAGKNGSDEAVYFA